MSRAARTVIFIVLFISTEITCILIVVTPYFLNLIEKRPTREMMQTTGT